LAAGIHGTLLPQNRNSLHHSKRGAGARSNQALCFRTTFPPQPASKRVGTRLLLLSLPIGFPYDTDHHVRSSFTTI
jgi:hypothetical protein